MDIVESGEPRRAPRGLVLGVVAALVAGGLAVAALRDRGDDPEPSASPTPVPTTTSPRPAPTQEHLPLAGPVTTDVRGQAFVVHAGQAVAVDLATGEQRFVQRVPHDVREVVRVGRRAVLVTGFTGDYPPVTSPVYVVRDDLGVRRISDAGTVVSDVEGTSVWVARWALGTDEGTVSRIGLDGKVRESARELHGATLEAAVRGGVVVSGFNGGVAVWNRDRLVHEERGLSFVAASPGRLLWAEEECRPRCSITWWDMPSAFSGENPCRCGVLETPAFPFHAGAALSPDGTRLAIQTTGRHVALHICTLATNTCVAPRNAVSTEPFALSWSPDSATLVVATAARYAQLAAWRPGWDELRLIPGSHPAEDVTVL